MLSLAQLSPSLLALISKWQLIWKTFHIIQTLTCFYLLGNKYQFTRITLYVAQFSLKFTEKPWFQQQFCNMCIKYQIWGLINHILWFLSQSFVKTSFATLDPTAMLRKRIRAFSWKNESRRTSTFNRIWWRPANRDLLPGRFQPYRGSGHLKIWDIISKWTTNWQRRLYLELLFVRILIRDIWRSLFSTG